MPWIDVGIGLAIGIVLDLVVTMLAGQPGLNWVPFVRGGLAGVVVGLTIALRWKAAIQKQIPRLWVCVIVFGGLVSAYNFPGQPRQSELIEFLKVVALALIAMVIVVGAIRSDQEELRVGESNQLQTVAEGAGIDVKVLEKNLSHMPTFLGQFYIAKLETMRGYSVSEEGAVEKLAQWSGTPVEEIKKLVLLARTDSN